MVDKPLAVWRKQGHAMIPANDVARAMLASLKEGGDYVGTFRGARSLKQLRLWWGLMNILVDYGLFPIPDAASDAVKIGCGYVTIFILPDTGEAYFHVRSIAFQSLPQHEFNVLFQAALDLIVKRWLVGTDADDLRREVFKAISPPGALGERIR